MISFCRPAHCLRCACVCVCLCEHVWECMSERAQWTWNIIIQHRGAYSVKLSNSGLSSILTTTYVLFFVSDLHINKSLSAHDFYEQNPFLFRSKLHQQIKNPRKICRFANVWINKKSFQEHSLSCLSPDKTSQIEEKRRIKKLYIEIETPQNQFA